MMLRIRFHGRGGQGMKTASRIVGSAAFHAGLVVQDSPIYGAERRGAPMSAMTRIAHEPIRERGAITRPTSWSLPTIPCSWTPPRCHSLGAMRSIRWCSIQRRPKPSCGTVGSLLSDACLSRTSRR